MKVVWPLLISQFKVIVYVVKSTYHDILGKLVKEQNEEEVETLSKEAKLA